MTDEVVQDREQTEEVNYQTFEESPTHRGSAMGLCGGLKPRAFALGLRYSAPTGFGLDALRATS